MADFPESDYWVYCMDSRCCEAGSWLSRFRASPLLATAPIFDGYAEEVVAVAFSYTSVLKKNAYCGLESKRLRVAVRIHAINLIFLPALYVEFF